jgi:signal transduction histidine kinase
MNNNEREYQAALDAIVPYEKLYELQRDIGLNEEDFMLLETHRDFLTSRQEEFADYFFRRFHEIGDTRVIMEHLGEPERLKSVWAKWFEFIFKSRLEKKLLSYLWRIGIKHVEVNLDQRYSNLGFSLAKQFCHSFIASELPTEKSISLNISVGKLLDFCLLVENTAYIETTSRCDIEIMRGIADRVRNPVTIIGGNLNRLIRKTEKEKPIYEVYETINYENQRIASLVNDVRIYVEMFLGEQEFEPISLRQAVDETLGRLGEELKQAGISPEFEIGAGADYVIGDKRQIYEMLYRLTKNSLEAVVDSKSPYVRIASSIAPRQPHDVQIEILNTGPVPSDFDKMFSPFYSTKPTGTGFGLAIALLAVRKNHGSLSVHPIKDGGLRFVILLPAKSVS